MNLSLSSGSLLPTPSGSLLPSSLEPRLLTSSSLRCSLSAITYLLSCSKTTWFLRFPISPSLCNSVFLKSLISLC